MNFGIPTAVADMRRPFCFDGEKAPYFVRRSIDQYGDFVGFLLAFEFVLPVFVFVAVGIGDGDPEGVGVLSVTTPALFEFCPGPQPSTITPDAKTAESVIKVFIAFLIRASFSAS